MARTVVNGANVTFVFGSTTLKVAALSLNTGQGTFDVSAFGSGSYIDRIGGGLKDLSGSASGFLESGAAACSPFTAMDVTGTMTITFDSAGGSAATVAFTAIIGNVSIDVSRSGIGVFRFDFAKSDSVDPTIGAWT